MADIVHKGPLDMATGLVGEKTWKRRLFVLKSFKSSGTAALEFYKDLKKDFHKQEVKGILNLMDNYQVEIVNAELTNCKRKYCFDVKTLESTYRLAADSESDMDDWVHYLQIQTTIKPVQGLGISFYVRPQQTGANHRLRARGECLLQMSQQGIKLALRSSGVILAEWPLKSLRRYSCDVGQFQFEAGRKAPLGEGIYGFLTTEEETMFDVLDYLVKSAAGHLVSPPMALTQRSSSVFNGRPEYHHLVHSVQGEREPPRVPPPPIPGSEYSTLSHNHRSRTTSPVEQGDSVRRHPGLPDEPAEYDTLQHRNVIPTGRAPAPRPPSVDHASPSSEYEILQSSVQAMSPSGAQSNGASSHAVSLDNQYDTLSHNRATSPGGGDMYNTLQHVNAAAALHDSSQFNHSEDYQQLSADAEKLTINVNYGQAPPATLRFSQKKKD